MSLLLFIYPLRSASPLCYRYAETARRLHNEKVDVRLLTVGKDLPLPSILENLPHQHISSNDLGNKHLRSLELQYRIWQYLMAIPKDGLSVFMNGLDFPLVFWACRKLDLPLIAQYPMERSHSVLYRKMIGWLGKSPKTALLYESQAYASSYRIRGFVQHIIPMPLSPSFLKAAQQHREMSQPKGNSWFSVIIGCREASAKTLKAISSIADQCEQIRLQCWFFSKEDLHKGSRFLESKANVSCVRPKENVSLYRTAKLYIEVEEPKAKPSEGHRLRHIREAMEFGLPVLLMRGCFGTEWISPGVNGYILESDQVVEMANKIRLLAHSNLLYDRLSNNASKMAQQWHPPKVCKALSDLLLAGKRKCTYISGLRQPTQHTT
ncbi:MAG: glycosyltransferase family 4 protein [Cyanothece sp. SIO1E1]|nr:glycosyltransferase family 4 protein [Cyanothece sp. SIO1E1]